MVRASRHRQLGLTLIAALKLVKVAVLLTVGIAALIFKDRAPQGSLDTWAHAVAPSNHWLHLGLAKISGASEKKLSLVSFGSFAYAAIFGVEGLGLWFQKTWAEYLTIVVTTSFIPLELYELTKRFSAAKVVTSLLNVAVVVYLVVRLVRERYRQRST